MRLFITALACFISVSMVGQDPVFNQYNQTQVFLNPSCAGNDTCLRISSLYRNQWPNMSGNYVTQAIAIDQYINSIHGGLGLTVLYDEAGQNSLRTTFITGMYSYQKSLTENLNIHAALSASYFQKSLDWSNLTFGDMIDPRRGLIYQTQYTPLGGKVKKIDIGAGILLYTDKLHLGFALHHLNKPNESLVVGLSRLPIRLTLHGGLILPTSTLEAQLTPNFRWLQQGDFTTINYGVTCSNNTFDFSLYGNYGNWQWQLEADVYDDNEYASSITGIVGLNFGGLRFGYSFTQLLHEMPSNGGIHEVSLGLRVRCKNKNQLKTINPNKNIISNKFEVPESETITVDKKSESDYKGNIRIFESKNEYNISTVAVIGKESTLCDGSKDDGQALAEVVEGALLSNYGVVERRHLEEILDEQRLAMSGLLLEDSDFAQAGCLAGAQGTVLASYGCLQGQTKLQIKLVDCSTSDLYWSATGLDVSAFDLMDALRIELSK